MQKIGVLGFGHMGKALVKGLVTQNLVQRENIFICARSTETLARAREEFGVCAIESAGEAVAFCDVLFLCVKKDVFMRLAPEIARAGLEGKTVVSLLAACTLQELRTSLGNAPALVRAMPTIGIAGGEGIIAYTQTKNAPLEAALHELGFAFETDEDGLDRATAYAGCGPGFTAYLIDAYIRAGVALGFDEQTSKHMAEMNFRGALKRSDYPAMMRETATKGGFTEFGMRHMSEHGVDENIGAAVRATYERLLGK